MTTDQYAPSPEGWVRDQVHEFETSDGERGNTLRGVPIVVMTMKGARTGKTRKVPVMRVEHEGEYAVVASKGGAPEHPRWYHNLQANSEVQLQDGASRTQMTVRELEGDERAVWWERSVAVWPDYAGYQRKTDRQIPVFLLSPTG